jgi:hypothetical protein
LPSRRKMGRRSKKVKAGKENRVRAPLEFEAGQHVLSGGKIAHITGVVYDMSTTHTCTPSGSRTTPSKSLLAFCNESQTYLICSRRVSS